MTLILHPRLGSPQPINLKAFGTQILRHFAQRLRITAASSNFMEIFFLLCRARKLESSDLLNNEGAKFHRSCLY